MPWVGLFVVSSRIVRRRAFSVCAGQLAGEGALSCVLLCGGAADGVGVIL